MSPVKLNINEFTICLHCGCNRDLVNNQMQALKPLESIYKVHWNNRIDRYPKMYPTYSQLINHSVVTSPTEWVILINDRCSPKPEEIQKMINLLENGFACVLFYGVGFMGFSKELIRQIGWWDERFIQGWEDRDWVWRLQINDIALYESCEALYDYSWRSPLNHPPGQCREEHLKLKYHFDSNMVYVNLPEEKYQHWDLFNGDSKEEIKNTWMKWNDSVLNLGYSKIGGGMAGSEYFKNRKIIKTYENVKNN
jgi:hypothetical protein